MELEFAVISCSVVMFWLRLSVLRVYGFNFPVRRSWGAQVFEVSGFSA